jgi:AraC-like DNA-binding protein
VSVRAALSARAATVTAVERGAAIQAHERGLVMPGVLWEVAEVRRYPPPASLADLVAWFWTVEWDVPAGRTHRQQVLTQPGANISVGTPQNGPEHAVEARLHGVATALAERELTSDGWTVAVLLRPGGLGAFVGSAARTFTDRTVPLSEATRMDPDTVVGQVCGAATPASRVQCLADALEGALLPERAGTAGQVAALAHRAEEDRTIKRDHQLARVAGVSVRTLQRMFSDYAGVSPSWVIRRYRLLDVFAVAHTDSWVDWVSVASDLGYADQAHLVRDFRCATGYTPASYAAAAQQTAQQALTGHAAGALDAAH